MARKFAQLHCDIWEDPDFLALSSEARFTFMACFAQKIVNYCGVLVYSPARMARATGYKVPVVTRALAELHRAGFVVVDEETGEILVRSFIVNNGVCNQPQLRKAMERCWGDILSADLKAAVLAGLPDTYKGTLRPACPQPDVGVDGRPSRDPGLRVNVVATDSDVIGNPSASDSLPVDEGFDGQSPGGWMAAKEARANLRPVPTTDEPMASGMGAGQADTHDQAVTL